MKAGEKKSRLKTVCKSQGERQLNRLNFTLEKEGNEKKL